jgi:hypothetical protein
MLIRPFSKDTQIDMSNSMYPSALSCHAGGETQLNDHTSTYYGFVLNGSVKITRPQQAPLECLKHMYFASPGSLSVSGDGQAVIIRRFGYRGLFQMGGPTESQGRLTYIDNCTTTLLVPPARLGDPAFNILYFPPGIRQTSHIHPSVRLGLVLSGSGHCVKPNAAPMALEPGMVFCISENEQHCFHSGEQGMSVIAYHPDSEWGPTDQSHPMLNRTYIR